MDAIDLLETIEEETGPDPRWAVLWLHGLGADGHDFVPLVPELVRPQWPAMRFVFPHAPVRAVTINAGMRMRAWYDIRDFDLANRADAEGVAVSTAQVGALLDREQARGIPPERTFLAGFSQGGRDRARGGAARARAAGRPRRAVDLPPDGARRSRARRRRRRHRRNRSSSRTATPTR